MTREHYFNTDHSLQNILDYTKSVRKTRIYVAQPREWAFTYWPQDGHDQDKVLDAVTSDLHAIKRESSKNNNTVIWILGSLSWSPDDITDSEQAVSNAVYDQKITKDTLLESPTLINHLNVRESNDIAVTILLWELFEIEFFPLWFSLEDGLRQPSIDNLRKSISTPKTKAFSCLNRNPLPHRIELFDQLAKLNLLEDNVVSWHEYVQPTGQFHFNHYNGEIKHLDVEDYNGLCNTYMNTLPPPQAAASLFDIVTESNLSAKFYTEKTYKNLWHCRPFIMLGRQHLNEDFKKLGFKQFEMFDYSFDALDQLDERCEALALQIKEICDAGEYDALYRQMLPTCHYNLKHLIKLLSDLRVNPMATWGESDTERTFDLHFFLYSLNTGFMSQMPESMNDWLLEAEKYIK